MPTAPPQARRWTIVVPDLPGYGRRRAPRPGVLGTPALAETVVALLDALGIDQAVLLGNSMGRPVALEVAHAAASACTAWSLVSPPGGVQNQPIVVGARRAGTDMFRESPGSSPSRPGRRARFGLVNGLRLVGAARRATRRWTVW